jgi:hypothetical protein
MMFSNSQLPYHHDHDGPLENNQENVPIRALKQHGDTFIRTLTIIREHWHIIEKTIIPNFGCFINRPDLFNSK